MKTPVQITETLQDKALYSLNNKTFKEVCIGGILAGTFVSIAASTSITVCADMARYFGTGFTKLISGIVFSLGLILIIISGGELFTGSNLFITAYYKDQSLWKRLLWFWLIVYIFNFVGSIIFVWLIVKSGIFNTTVYSRYVISITEAKVSLTFLQAFVRGVLCNFMVCLAIRAGEASDEIIGKVIVFVYTISAFVINSFEHCVANMFFVPLGIYYGTKEGINLTLTAFLQKNLIPVTLGNIVGGALFVATLYFIMHCNCIDKQI